MLKYASTFFLLLAGAPAVAQVDTVDAAIEAHDWATAVSELEASVAATGSVDGYYRLGVARALAGDAAGAGEAFREVMRLDPAFPGIADRVAAADRRAALDEAEALDPPGFFTDDAVAIDVRRAALTSGDLLNAARAAANAPPTADPTADSLEARALAMADDAAVYAVEAAAAAPGDLHAYLFAADALRLAGRLEAARYYLDLYDGLDGDPEESARIRQAIDRAERSVDP